MRASTMPFYYGWAVLAASAVSELLAQGATSYAAGLFVLPLQAEFHISRAAANSAVLILFLGAAVAAPLVGRALDRFSIRLVVPLGALVFAGGLMVVAGAPSLTVMALALLVPVAIGFSAIGPLTTSTLAARWFRKRRGLALGIAAVATSGGGFVVVPFLSRAIAEQGWRAALFHEALIIAAIVIALSLLVLRDTPAAVGLDGHAENQGPAIAAATPRWTVILSRRAFWVPALALAVISGISQALVVSFVPLGVELGIAARDAAFFISAFALAAAVTKIAGGILADRMNQNTLILAAVLALLAAEALLYLVPGQQTLLAASLLAGVALGCVLPTAAGLIAAGFGPANFGAAMGWAYVFVLLLAIAATLFIGMVFDRVHGYGPAFATFLVLTALVLLAELALARARPAA